MTRRLGFLLFLLFLTFVAATAYADIAAFYDSYYSDGTFTVQVGEHDKECDGTISTNWGTTSDYRYRQSWICSNQLYSTQCQQLIDGRWVTVQCP